MDLTDLLVDRVVVHRIPRRQPKATEEQQEALALSEAVTPLDDDGDRLRAYMTLRLQRSLLSMDKAFDVVFDEGTASPIPPQVRHYLSDELDGTGTLQARDQALVGLSREMAERLFDVQPTQPPTGLLAVCSGTVGGMPLVAVMKLEHERGVTVDERLVNGLRTFQMTVEDDLVLTEGTKVFKAAAFAVTTGQVAGTGADDLECDARVSDTQAAFQASAVAAYYTVDFLGVRLSDAPRVTTERVFKAIETFVNDTLEDPARQVAAARALLVEMSANKPTFSAQSFGNQHLEPAERHALRDHLQSADLPVQGFPKDTELIAGRLRMLALEMDGHITVVAPEDRFEDNTITVDAAGGDAQAVVTIRSGLRRTQSRGR